MAFDHAPIDAADVGQQLDVGGDRLLPLAAVEQVEVDSGHGVAVLLQQVDQVGADVALVTGDENSHGDCSLDGPAGGRPRPKSRSAWSAMWRAIARDEVAPGEGAFRTCSARSLWENTKSS